MLKHHRGKIAQSDLTKSNYKTMTDENIKVTQALLDANTHLDVEIDDTVLSSQVTAPITQEMLDADPDLVVRGLKVGDLINAPVSTPKTFSVTGTLDKDGNFTAQITGDVTGSASGTLNVDGSFSGSFDGNVPTA